MRTQAPEGSSLSRAVGGFAHSLAVLSIILLAPLAAKHIRPELYQYLAGEFPYDWALWGSWGCLALIGLCCFFGLSILFQLGVQMLLRASIKKGGF